MKHWIDLPNLQFNVEDIYVFMKDRDLMYFDHCIPKGPARTKFGNPFNTKSAEISLGPDFDYTEMLERIRSHTGLIIGNPAMDIKIVSSTMGIGRHVDSPDRPFTIVFPMNEVAKETTTIFYKNIDTPDVSDSFQFTSYTAKLLDTACSHEVKIVSERRRDTIMILIRDPSTMHPELKDYFGLAKKKHNDWMNIPKIHVKPDVIYDFMKGRTLNWIDYGVPKNANRVRVGTYDDVQTGEISLGPDFDYSMIINSVRANTGVTIQDPVNDIKIVTTTSGLKKHVDRADRPFTIVTPLNDIAEMTQTIFFKDQTCTDISSILKYRNDSKILKTSKWHEVVQEQTARRDTLMILIRDTSMLYTHIKTFFGIK